MSSSPESCPESPAARGVPRWLVAGSVAAVIGTNLGILGYAVALHRPGATAGGDTAPERAELAPGAADGSETTATGGDVTSPGATTLTSTSVGDSGMDEDDDWVYEPVRVVNDLHLPSMEEVRPAFIRNCASCHGIDGRGDGPAADLLLPPPRDFVGSVFRYAATDADRGHTIRDLERTVTQGVPRSAMPAFGGVLPEREIAGLARYVLALREQEGEPDAPMDYIDIGARPPLTPELVARGSELYTQMACNTCHGDTGRGDGANSLGLVDFQGRPVRPADLTSGLFKTGQAPEDLCRTILRGVPGTPMVAYEGILAQDNDDDSVNTLDAWSLVAFIRSLAPVSPPSGLASGAHLVAVPAPDDAMLTDPSHVAWLGITPTAVELKPMQPSLDQATGLVVRVVRSHDRIAVCLEWADATADIVRGEGLLADAVSINFGLGDGIPALPVGVEPVGGQEYTPTNLWRWSAAQQYDAVTGQRHASLTKGQPNGDSWYLFVDGPDARLPEVVAIPESDPISVAHAVLEANADRDGRITVQPSDGQSTTATSAWTNGLWRVVMVRSLERLNETDVQFAPGHPLPISFAVQDGSAGDQGGPALISSWHWVNSGG